MKTHAILFDNSKYKCQTDSVESIYMVVNYIIKPYIDLDTFSFNNYYNVPDPIIGSKRKEKLLKAIIQWSGIRKELISTIKKEKINPFIIGLDNLEAINDLKIICGIYNYEMQFYNDISKDSTLTDLCYNKISRNPEKYILAFTNVYK